MSYVTETWVIQWFPPEAVDRKRTFRTEKAAREFAATEEVAVWNPLMERHLVTTTTTVELIPLEAP